ncbi:MAG: hypothetical protein RLZZ187_3692 [Pseudomonadota bacterium]
MEQKIVQRLCPQSSVRRIGCNGKDVDMTVMAKFISAQIPLLKKHHPIIIIFDREKRKKGRKQLESELKDILSNFINPDSIVIGIPDLTTENWILAGWDGVKEKYPHYLDCKKINLGKNGKSQIKKLLPAGEIYTENILGPKLFSAADPNKMYQNDESFRDFISRLKLDCHWVGRINQG